MGFYTSGMVQITGFINSSDDLFVEFTLMDAPLDTTGVEVLIGPTGNGFRYNSIRRTLSGFIRAKSPNDLYHWVFRLLSPTNPTVYTITTTPAAIVAAVAPEVSPVNTPNAVEPTPPQTQPPASLPSPGSAAYAAIGGVAPQQTPTAYFNTAPPSNSPTTTNPAPPTLGSTPAWSAQPPAGTAPTNTNPSNPPANPPQPPTVQPAPRPVVPVKKLVSNVWIDVYPPDWITMAEGRLEVVKNTVTYLYAVPGDTVEWILSVDRNWPAGSSNDQGAVTSIAITAGEIPEGFTIDYPYNGDNQKARLHGTMPFLWWPQEFLFIVTATNENTAYYDRVYSIYGEPDRGYVTINSPVPTSGGGTSDNVDLSIGGNVTKVYWQLWGGGGGGHVNGFAGAGGAMVRALISATSGDEWLLAMGRGGLSASEHNQAAGEDGLATYLYTITRDRDPESPTFGAISSQTLLMCAPGGSGASSTSDGSGMSTAQTAMGDEVTDGTGYFPGGYLGDHIGSIGNAYGGSPATNGGYGRAYFEYGPHINAVSSLSQLDV